MGQERCSEISETSPADHEALWLRGGFPRSILSANNEGRMAWREGFISTFLERDIPQLGITIPSTAMRRFRTMLSHYHGQYWNSSGLARSMGLSDKTVRSYLVLSDFSTLHGHPKVGATWEGFAIEQVIQAVGVILLGDPQRCGN